MLVFGVGVVIATATPGPLLTADDLAYLGMARTLAGDGAAPMAPQPPVRRSFRFCTHLFVASRSSPPNKPS